MFTDGYFPQAYFPHRYFPEIGESNALNLSIGGIDRTEFLAVDSLIVGDILNSRDTLQLTVVSKGPASNYYRPLEGEPIIVFGGGCTLFAGTIERLSERVLMREDPAGTRGGLAVKMECTDFNQIADRNLVARIFESQLAGDIVKDIVGQELSGQGLTTAGVEDGILIERAVFGFKTPAEVFNELSDLIGFHWYIDHDKDVKFFDRATFAAPFDIAVGDKKYHAASMVVDRQREQYRNVQIVRAGRDLTDVQNNSFLGDTKIKSFVCEFDVGEVPTVTVNGAPRTIGIRGLEDSKDFYWQKGEKEITQDADATALTTSETLLVVYKGLFPIIVLRDDPAQQFERASIEGGTGVYEAIVDDRSIEKREFAVQKADGLLRRFGVIPEIVKWQDDDMRCAALLRAGQLININLPEHNLNGNFLIDKITYRDVAGKRIRANITALSGEHLGSWHEFFRRMSESQRDFRLNEEEVLLLIRQFTETLKLTEAFNTVDALAAANTDPFTCWVWDSATWGKSEWCEVEP